MYYLKEKMFQILASCLLACMLVLGAGSIPVSAAVGSTEIPDPDPLSAVTAVEVEIPRGNYKDPYRLSGEYTDAYFFRDSRKEQPELAFLSGLAAATTYSYDNKKNYTRNMLKACGFAVKDKFLFSKTGKAGGTSTVKDNDHARVQLGFKVIKKGGKNTLLTAAVISGYTTSHAEWVSNFNLGKGKTVAGFSKAADEVYALTMKKVKEYRKSRDIRISELRFWVMGHSRGAAVANLMGARLSKTYGKKKVYTYCFATPNVSKKVITAGNIHNYIIEEDFVTHLAPAEWGYRRNGEEILLKPGKKSKAQFEEIDGQSYDGFTRKQVQDFTKKFLAMTDGEKNYYKNRGTAKDPVIPAEFCQKGIGYVMHTDSTVQTKGLLLMEDYSVRDKKCEALYDDLWKYTFGQQISDTHKMVNYLSVMMTR